MRKTESVLKAFLILWGLSFAVACVAVSLYANASALSR